MVSGASPIRRLSVFSFCIGSWILTTTVAAGPPYCTSSLSQTGPVPCPAGSHLLSPFTNIGFVPDGEICEFIQLFGDGQGYFETDPSLEFPLQPNFGAILSSGGLTFGVVTSRDNLPAPGNLNASGPSGHRDPPAAVPSGFLPTGFNIGRVFASYNPRAFGGEGAYFLAMDISAPAALDTQEGTQPVAFDVDGDGDRCAQSELATANTVEEAPTVDDDKYAIGIDTNNDGVLDVRILIIERAGGGVPFGAVAIDPGGVIQMLPGKSGTLVPVRRLLLFEDLSGLLFSDPALDTPLEQAVFFLDINGDGVVNHLDVGVDSDIELVVRRVARLPRNSSPACSRFTFLADSFDDVAWGGAEEKVIVSTEFPVPDIEVIKEVRCVEGAATSFRRTLEVTPGSTVEFRITTQNWGNRPLDVFVTDVVTETAPAALELVPGSCQVSQASLDLPPDFCARFEQAFQAPALFPIPGGTLESEDRCSVGLGESFQFTFRATVEGAIGDARLCDQEVDVRNAVTVFGTLSVAENPILPPSPLSILDGDAASAADAEEEDCIDETCCAAVPACPTLDVCQGGICTLTTCPAQDCAPMDSVGDVRDEYLVTVEDLPGVRDTLRELAAAGIDDNVVTLEIQCRGIELTKEVRLLGPTGPFTSGDVRLDVLSAPRDIEYRFTVQNLGEVDEEITLTDPICGDVAAVAAALPGQISFVACPICNVPPQADPTPTVPAASTFQTSCIVHFETEAALRAFTRADDGRESCRALTKSGKPDVLCYRNCAAVAANPVNLAGACPDGTIGDDSFAVVCHPVCDIEVTKQVRCLDNCEDKNPIGGAKDLLETTREGCLEFEITIANISEDIPMCRLRIEDFLSDQETCIEYAGGVAFRVGDTECPPPACFNVSGTPCDWVPGTCGLAALAPGQVLSITFNASIPEDAPLTCGPMVNSVSVDGASDPRLNCEVGFTCADEDSAEVDLLEPALFCRGKEWAFQWDSDGDCEPESPFSEYRPDVDLRDKVFPVLARLRVRAENTGQVPLDVTVEDLPLVDCITQVAGAAIAAAPACELGVAKLLAPGESGEWACDIRVETSTALRELDACDGAADGFYDNRARVYGRLVRGASNTCPPDEIVIEGSEEDPDCSASIRVPEVCDLDVVKQVKCADDPDASYAADVDAIAGSRLSYRIQITNEDALVKLPRVCVTDDLDCVGTVVAGSFAADIDGTAVTACLAGFVQGLQDGTRRCHTFAACRAAMPWIAPGETLTLTFQVDVPPDFDEVGTDPDCTNDVVVEGFAEVCVPAEVADAACDEAESHAEFDVLIPHLNCDKTVGADLDNDGDLEVDYTDNLSLPCDTLLPFTLEYKFVATNKGETPLLNVQVCDAELVADARAAGLIVGPCGLCNEASCDGVGDTCAPLPALAPGAMRMAVCRIRVPSRAAWEAFAGRDADGDRHVYANTSTASANVDAAEICDFRADTRVVSQACSATAHLAPECQISVTKKVRCLDNCEDKNEIGDAKDALQAAPGSCVEFEVAITNTSPDLPICRLRISDTLSRQPAHIVFAEGVAFRVGDEDCEVPGGPDGFNVDGRPFLWDPATCGLSSLLPGATLTITFQAEIPLDADPEVSPVNSISVDGAPTCPAAAPNFCCRGAEDASIDILRPRLTCLGKEWAIQWDSDGDCLPEEPFSGFGSTADLRDKVFPVRLQLRVRSRNTGEVPLDVVAEDEALRECLMNTPGVAVCEGATCELDQTKRLMPNEQADWFCEVCIETADAMRGLAACDGAADDRYVNTASVSGTLVRDDTNICVPQERTIPGDQTCSAVILAPAPCEIDVIKQVRCGDDPDSAYAAEIEVLPGSAQRFRIQITNDSTLTKVPRVCTTDVLSCEPWLDAESCRADLAGTDVTACVCPAFENSLNGSPVCHSFAACRAMAPWLAPQETLTITFDTHVPADHDSLADPDCVNDLAVDAYTEVCSPVTVPEAPCDSGSGRAEYDVLLSSIECEKEVAADFNGDGRLDTDFSRALLLRCDTAFPFTLEYRWSVTNMGETPQADVRLCDPALVSQARAAGLTIGACALCNEPSCDGLNDACAVIGLLGSGESAVRTCRITVPSRGAWESFAGLDPDGDANCHTNESTTQGLIDTRELCDFGADINVSGEKPCSAAVCLAAECQIAVTKLARCLDCADRAGFGGDRDPIPVAPGSCLQFQVDIRNTDPAGNICRLRICDQLTNAGQIVYEGNVRFRVGDVTCPAPPAFNVTGQCFDWSPSDCGLPGLGPNQALTITFDARIPLTANPDLSPVNNVTVDAAPTCKGGAAQFCCRDSADTTIDILRPALRCDGKEWAVQWDSDGDCEPDEPFSNFGHDADLRDKVLPAQLRLRVQVSNNGQVPVDATVDDPTLITCASTTPGVSLASMGICEIGQTKAIPAGGSTEWLCDLRLEKAEALRDLDLCDGVLDGVYTNKAIVTGQAVPGPNAICVPNGSPVPVDHVNCFARILVPEPCRFTVNKTAQCVSGCGAAALPQAQPTPALEVVPGAWVRYAVAVTNSDSRVKIPRICVTDVLDCGNWPCLPSSVRASLAGTDVSGDFQTFAADGRRRCFTFGRRAAAPWIAPQETLILSFDVRVPPGFAEAGVVPDCLNEVTIEGFTETCAPPECDGCVIVRDSASIDVQVPRLECQKAIAVDLGNDGSVDVAPAASLNLSNPPFPLRLIYTITARNAGDMPLSGVSLCDDQLVADARAAGLTVGPCLLCNDAGCDGIGDACRVTGNLGVAASAAVTCQIIVENESQWDELAGRDAPENRRECYLNRAEIQGTAVPSCAPPGFDPRIRSQPCEALICVTIVRRCPVTKATFDVWNEDERRFSGTERCITSWDQTLLSRYARPGIPNHFLQSSIHTSRGLARIDGLAGSNFCGPETIAAPLLGVAAKVVNFGRGGIDRSGLSLIGVGTESGTIVYQPTSATPLDRAVAGETSPKGIRPSEARPSRPFGSLNRVIARGSETEKGSLLVYPKVEVKWDSQGQPIQDTFITVVNDLNDDVLVQFYFVNGDQETDPVSIVGPPPIEERGHMGCNWVDVLVPLTANQPIYWSALTGDPRNVSPFTILDPGDPPGRPDDDPWNPGGRVLRGYVLAWAVNLDNQEIRWNHLTGEAVVINYLDMSAWDYHPWALQAVSGATNGTLLDPPFGRLDLDGFEYDALPARLLMPFVTTGSVITSFDGTEVFFDTDLTLWVGTKDLRDP